MSSTTPAPATTNWWMFHGNPAHTGEITDSAINSTNASKLQLLKSVPTLGSILSTPAIVDGFVYVGLSNTQVPQVPTGIGGTLLKLDITTGDTVDSFNWSIDLDQRDSHGFAGMGCTPAVVNGLIYFMGFNGILYCLDTSNLSKIVWQTNLRCADDTQNQPITNVFPDPASGAPSFPQAAGWSSPVVANGHVWVGIGEGENPNLMSFVYCLDATSGRVQWIFCTNKYSADADNTPNVLPAAYTTGTVSPPFTTTDAQPQWLGCSIWSGIAYDAELGLLYISTGNPTTPKVQPPYNDPGIPTPNSYAYGILVLKAESGDFVAFRQFPEGSSYRPTDNDVDVGGSPTLYTIDGRKVVGVGSKNGSFMICDAQTLEILNWRQMLPTIGNLKQITTGGWIESVDPHGPDIPENPRPVRTNEESNTLSPDPTYSYENYQGTYSTAATCSSQQKIFIGLGGNNYHYLAPGIDSDNTPFLRAMTWDTLDDAWPVAGNPAKYINGTPPLYNAGESGISVPAVVNDVVFMATTGVALYAFNAKDGTLLWSDSMNFGAQTGGYSGGYGYCMGPAVWGNYVVAGALVQGSGGVLNIYVYKPS